MIKYPEECPNCNSKNIVIEDIGGYAYAVIGIHCLDCGFVEAIGVDI